MVASLAACSSNDSKPADAPAASSKPAASASSSQEKEPAKSTAASGETDYTQGESLVIRTGHANPEGTPMAEGHNEFKRQVEEMTGGRIEVQVYSNAQLGSDRELIEAVQMGNVEICTPTSTPVASFAPDYFVYDSPFMFTTREQGRAVFEDPEIVEKVKSFSHDANLLYMSTWENGFRHVTCNKEIRTPEQMKGLKIRTMENELHLAVWKAMGANPTPMAYGELYTALQQRTIDAQENPYAQAVQTKFYEVQSHLIETSHMYLPFIVLGGVEWYDNLSEEDKFVVDTCMEKATDYEFEFAAEMEAQFRQELIDQGMTIVTLTEEERDVFKQMCEDAGIRQMAIDKCTDKEFANLFYEKVDASTK